MNLRYYIGAGFLILEHPSFGEGAICLDDEHCFFLRKKAFGIWVAFCPEFDLFSSF
jgi:hypothetical protein